MNHKSLGSTDSSVAVQIAAFIIIFAGVIYAKTFITPILLALFISIICAQPIAWLVQRRVPKAVAFLVILVGLILVFSGFAFVIGGSVSSFADNVSDYETTLTDISNTFIQYLKDIGVNLSTEQLSNLIQPAKILSLTGNALSSVINMMGQTFMIFLIVLFILMEVGSFPIKAKAILSRSGRSANYFSIITKNIRNYLWIKTLISLAVGVLIYFALLIIGVDYPVLWALIAILFNYIPNIGSIIATVPAVLFALVQLGTGGAIWTLVSFTLIHNFVGNFIEPKIMGKGLGLSTLVVFVSLLFWGFVFGTVGMILSVPFTMTIKIILEQNEKTKWIALMLGTQEEAENYLIANEPVNSNEKQSEISL